MQNKNFSPRKKLVSVVGLIAGVLIFLAFQNCAPAFKTVDLESLSSGSSTLGSTAGELKQNPFSCTNPALQAVNQLQRMSRVQYGNNLKNLVGMTVYGQVSNLINTLYDDTLKKSVGDFSNTISDTQMTAYQAIAEAVYNYLKANPTVAQQIAGSCFAQATVTDACRDAFINKLGQSAYRRPLVASEVQQFATQIFPMADNPTDAVGLMIYTVMLAPDFLLHLELGSATSADSATYDVTPYEVAARLSYGLTDSPPDDSLMAAAAAGQLSNLTQIGVQVDRLLQTPAARDKIDNFFTYWLDPRRYAATEYAPDFTQGLDIVAANDEYSREMFEYINYVIFTKKGSFEDLILGRESFARTAAVAQIYGHTAVTGSAPAQMSADRKGLLMRGAVIANDGNETHPILRGVKFRNRFLCEAFGLPSGINTNDPTFFSDTARAHLSTRDRTAGITAASTCMGCHSSINPVGFSFENFDSIGRVRPIESAFSSAGKVLAQFPIKTDSAAVFLGVKTTTVTDSLNLIDTVMQENILPGCFVRQVSRFYRVKLETAEDACLLGGMYGKGISDPNAPMLEIFRQQFLNPNILKRRMN